MTTHKDPKASQYNFDLPVGNIANYPSEDRHTAKMMVLHRKTGKIEDRLASDIFDYFSEGDVFVKNDSKVSHRFFSSAITGISNRRGKQTKIQMLLHREINAEKGLWEVLVHPSRQVRSNQEILFCSGNVKAMVLDAVLGRMRIVRISKYKQEEFYAEIQKHGEPYLPGYIKRMPEPEDAEAYQNTYAKTEGGINPPSAGFCFSPYMNRKQDLLGIKSAYITRHIAMDSFSKVDLKFIENHKGATEYAKVEQSTAEILNQAKEGKRQILAIGISSLLTIDDCSDQNGICYPCDAYTSSFVYPNYTSKVATSLLTGFHIPMSQFLIQTCSFGGMSEVKKAYIHALNNNYKFGAYGDKLLIL